MAENNSQASARDHGARAGAVTPELDEMVCDLIGYILDELADGRDPGVVACVEDAHGARDEAAFSDDGEEVCLLAAQEFIQHHKRGDAPSRQASGGDGDPMGPADRYAYAYTGAVELDGEYADALLVSFYEKALPCGYSAYVLYQGVGEGDDFVWSEPAPAGEELPLI